MIEGYHFVRGEHPNETLAYVMAEDIANVLKKFGRTVEVEDVDVRKTNNWLARQLLAGKKPDIHLSIRQGYMRAVRNPKSVFFNFHNSLWNGIPPEEYPGFGYTMPLGGPHYTIERALNYFFIEIPAIFEKAADKRLNRGMQTLDELMKKSKSGNVRGMALNASHLTKEVCKMWNYPKGYLTPENSGYAAFVDMNASREADLMSPSLVEFYAKGIDELATKYLGKVSVKP